MKNIDFKITSLDGINEELNNQIEEYLFKNEIKYLHIRLIFVNCSMEDDKLYNLCNTLMSSNPIIITEIIHENVKSDEIVSNNDLIIFGDVLKNMCIFTNNNVKVIGTIYGSIVSDVDIKVYANMFSNANIIIKKQNYFIDEKDNFTFNQ